MYCKGRRCGCLWGGLSSRSHGFKRFVGSGSTLIAEPGDLGAAGGSPALDEHEAVAHAQRVAARERRHAAVGTEGVGRASSTLANPLPPRSMKSCTARSSASEMGLTDGCEFHGLRARSRFMTMALSSEADSALFEVPTRVKYSARRPSWGRRRPRRPP